VPGGTSGRCERPPARALGRWAVRPEGEELLVGPGRGDRQAPDQAKGFVLLHRRWVVERSFAWLTKFRRLVRDYETLPATHEAMIWTAATWQLSNRLTR
jgi:transposase